jgi:hypothetical protein
VEEVCVLCHVCARAGGRVFVKKRGGPCVRVCVVECASVNKCVRAWETAEQALG